MRTRKVEGPKRLACLKIRVTNPQEIEWLLARGHQVDRLFRGENGYAFEALSPEEQLAELKCAEESRQAWKQYIASLKEMVGSMTGKTNDHTESKNVATIHKEDAK